MFADCAFPQPYGPNPTYLIEYSFAEAYHWVFQPGEETSYRADPSIHFRHRDQANVVWCDGHVSSERLQTEAGGYFSEWDLGWFGPADNSLFDPD
jgi:prepilin-type processing-associated H-X9-DG protein